MHELAIIFNQAAQRGGFVVQRGGFMRDEPNIVQGQVVIDEGGAWFLQSLTSTKRCFAAI